MTTEREYVPVNYIAAVESEDRLNAVLAWHREHEHDRRKAIR